MQDFPVFATENGVGSLILKEIPYGGVAYIHIRDCAEPKLFLQECVDFCKTAGAQKIYAKGHAILQDRPVHTAIWQMRVQRDGVPQSDAMLFPVTERTMEKWRGIYNEKMRNVANSAYISFMEMKQLVKKGECYFVHQDGQLIGLGMASEDRIEAVISVTPGGGSQVVSALCEIMTADTITLEVASVNEKAVALYTSMGFIKSQELAVWHQIVL